MNRSNFLAGLCLAAAACSAFGQLITTVAGTDISFQGQGSPGTAVSLGRVVGITIDPSGQPVFADPYYNLILRVDPGGKLQVIAGNNVQGLSKTQPSGILRASSGGGYSGDGGPAQYAALNRPNGVAYDASGNLYIADQLNNRIRKVTPQGTITTFAGTGQPAFGGDNGPAASAGLNSPIGVAVDGAGNVYVNDYLNCRIRKITPQGIISTLAGNDCSSSSSPVLAGVEAIAADSQGNVYIAEQLAHRVRKITPSGQLVAFAGTGKPAFGGDGQAATAANLAAPSGVAVDRDGNVYISDTGNSRIRMVGSNGVISTIAGNGNQGLSGDTGPALAATMANPFGIAVSPTGEIYFADRDNFRLRHIDRQKRIETVAGDSRLIGSHDNGPATLAPLLDPFGVSVDASGSLLIADSDNNVIRRVNASGVITTIAGNGYAQSTPDPLPALQSSVLTPFSAAADATGNIVIADTGGFAIRALGADAILRTIAGNGTNVPLQVPTQAIPDGNGHTLIADYNTGQILRLAPAGTATVLASGLSNPAGIALDTRGNVYVTEFTAGRVKKITPAGVVSVIGGGGQATGSAAEGHPASNAALSNPSGIAVDTAGNVFFSESQANRVRRIGLDGNLTTIAGTGRPGYSGDGGVASAATLYFPWGLAIDNRNGTLYIADALNNRIRAVVQAPASFTTSPTSLSISAVSDGAITDAVPVNVASATANYSGLLFSVSTSGDNWLKVTSTVGAMPAVVNVQADPTGLAPGNYKATVNITAPAANPPVQAVTVNLTVAPGAPAQIAADTNSINIPFVAGSPAVTRQVQIKNLGSGQLAFAASATLLNGSGWLTVSPSSGTATPSSPATVAIAIDPSSLGPGTYGANLTIADSKGPSSVSIPVTITVNALPGQIFLSQTAFSFTAVAGGGAPPSAAIGILNSGQGSMPWSAQASVLSTGTNWLHVSAASGTVQTANSDISPLDVSVDASSLAPGTYYGQVQVSSTKAANSPQAATIQLTVLPAGSAPPLQVQPAALTFTGTQGANPSSQFVNVSNLSAAGVTYDSSRSTDDGQDWFVHVPTNATVSPSQQTRVVVQPDFTNLSPGVHRGTITLRFPSGSRTVGILSIVQGASGASSSTASDRSDRLPQAGCSSQAPLRPQIQSLSTPFTVTVGTGVPLSVLVQDNCGTPITTGTVTAEFGNGDPELRLTHTQNGVWTGTWNPITAKAPMQMVVRATTSLGPLSFVTGNSDILSGSAVTARAPIVGHGGIVSAASSAAARAVAPCSLVSIYGLGLADQPAGTDSVPLQSTLAATRVFVGGIPIPLKYASDSQVNAEIPCELNVDTQHQVIVQNGNALSTPEPINVASAQPAIFTLNQQGTGQGIIVNFATNLIAQPGAPVKAGDVIIIYCAGLGVTDPLVPSGQLPTGLAPTVNKVSLTIGGQDAQVFFAGLTPQFPAVYQINAFVPNGVAPGDQVPVTITAAGQTSPVVTMAVQ